MIIVKKRYHIDVRLVMQYQKKHEKIGSVSRDFIEKYRIFRQKTCFSIKDASESL